MYKPNFNDAHLKLSRACRHIAEVDARLASYLCSDFYAIETKLDQATRRLRVELQSLHQPDKAFNAVVGDAIGNLRSVLDYIAVALVVPIIGKADSIGFPFADDVNGFKGMVSKGQLSKLPQVFQDHLLNEVQAYKGGKGHSFWIVNKLRNIDKHRLLVATTEMAGATISFRAGGVVVENATTKILAGQNCCMIDVPANAQITNKPTAVFEVSFNEAPFIEHVPVSGFLHTVAKDLECMLDAFKMI